MFPTDRDYQILRKLRRYWYLETRQLRDLVIPHDTDCAITRGRLRKMEGDAHIRRHQPKKTRPGIGLQVPSAPPIWVLTVKGSCALATHDNDRSLELPFEPDFNNWMNLWHYVSLAQLHMVLDDAIAAQVPASDGVKLHALYFEHEVINPREEGGKKYRLYTPIDDKVVACPDSAWETEVAGYRRAWLTEYEMGSDTPRRIAAKKCKGMAGLIGKGLYRRFFPHARDARVICFCPNASFRDALRGEMKNKPGAEFWVFLDTSKLSAMTILTQDLVYTVDKGPFPLFPRRPAAAPAPETGAGGGTGDIVLTEIVKQ